MFQSCKITLPPNVINHQYKFHHNHFKTLNTFRQFIIEQNELSNSSFDTYGTATIKYNNLFQNNQQIFGIYHNWQLIKFITQSSNNQKRKKYKSRRKIHIKKDGRSYDEDIMKNGNIKISKQMSLELVPNTINQTHIKNIFAYMTKLAALNPKSNNKIWILNVGLTDKNTNKYIYFIADKIQNSTARSYAWKMRDKIYNEPEIIELTNQLPIHISDTDEFKIKLGNVAIMEEMLNDIKIQNILFNTKIKWENVPIFTNEKETNKTQLHLNKSKPIFIRDIKNILLNLKNIQLKPILLFNHNSFKNDIYNIDGLLRIKLNGNDIGISFKYNNGKMLPSGFHLDLENILLMNQLVQPNVFDNYFNNWETVINDMSIGNKNKYKNQFNAKSIECERYKQRTQQYSNILNQILNTLQNSNQSIQIDQNLLNLMQTGNNMLQSDHNDSNVLNTEDLHSNQYIKHDIADNCVPEYFNNIQMDTATAMQSNNNYSNVNLNQQFTLPLIDNINNQFSFINGAGTGGNLVSNGIGMINASMLIPQLQGQVPMQQSLTIESVQNNNVNGGSTSLNIDAQVFVPTPNKSKLDTIME